MTSEHKKSLLLLNSVIFNYHGFDKEEQIILENLARELDAFEEFSWVKQFVQQDVSTLFVRASEFFKNTINNYDKNTKISYLNRVWEATNKKGHITEMEAMAILKLARDWGVQKEFLGLVRK
jgi:hypothetical protein